MNNIYKVIWSKAKNCYVVASEIARSHTKSASGAEKIGGVARHALLALGAACAIACGGFVNVGAAETVEAQITGGSTATVYTKEGTESYVQTNTYTKSQTYTQEQVKKLINDLKTGDVATNKDNITTLKGKTVGLSTDGKSLNGMNSVETGALKVTGQISNGADVTTTLADIKASMDKTTANEGNIGELQRKTQKIDYDVASDTTNVNGMKVGDQVDMGGKELTNVGNINGINIGDAQVDMGGKKLTNVGTINGIDIGDAQVNMNDKNLTGVGTINGTAIGTKVEGNYIHTDSSIWGNMKNVDTQVKTNADAIAQEKTDRENAIGSLTENKNYIEKAKNVSDNLVELDKQAKTNADNIKNNKDEIARVNGELVKTNNHFNTELRKTNDYFNTELRKTNNHFNTELGKTNAALQEEGKVRANADAALANDITATNKRTAGIGRKDTGVEADNQTVIEGTVHFDQKGNVSGVKDLQTDTIHAIGEITSKGLNAGDGDIKTTGKVSAGDVSTGTLETTGNAKIGGDLTVNGKLNVDKISMKNNELKNGKKHDSATTITADEISNLAKVTEQGNTTESQFTHNEKGTFNYAKDEKSTGEWKRATSNVTANGVANTMTDSDGNTHTYYQTATETKEQLVNGDKSNFEKKTAEGNTISIKDKDADGNDKSLTNKQTADEEKTSVTNKDSSSTIKQGADQIRYNVTSKDENKTSSSIEVKADGITNTSKDGTIINDAKDIENNATGDITNTAQNGSIINKAENGDISNKAKNVTNEGTESVTNKVGANEVKVSTDGVDIKAEAGKTIKESVGADTSRTMTDGNIIDQAGDMTVTTDKTTGTTFGNGTPKDTTVINGGTIGTNKVNANETNTKKLTAGAAAGADGGRLTVDANDGVKGSYKSSNYTSRSYILANTLKSGVDNDKDPTEDGFVGSRTDHYMDEDKAKLDETVKDADGSNVTNKTSTGTVTTITDGNTTTKTEQGVKDITNTAKDGTITNDAKDIVNNAQDTITNTAGTSITNQVKDSKVTTDANGTTFENKTAAVSDGGTTTTKINGNRINTGRVDANELAVSDKDGDNTADFSVKAGEGNKGGIKGSVTDKDGNKTYTKVTATENSFQVQDKDGNIKNHQVNTKDKSENTITNGTKANTVTSTADGTTFNNSKANTVFEGGTYTDTTIKGNTITTGKVTMDYADVMRDLGVRGNATVDKDMTVKGNTTLGEAGKDTTLTVNSKATFNEKATFEKGAEVKNGLTVSSGESTFNDKVTMKNGLDVTGGVASDSFTVKGTDIKIDSSGINAGGTVISNVADGSISEGSKDAVNGGQLYQVKNDLEGKVNKVGANAAAMANLHPMEFDPDSKWNIAAAMGSYGSETATAIGAFYRPNEDVMVNFSTAFGTGENMVGGGVSVRLGKGSNKLSREESNALKDQVNDLTARMDALLSVLNPNMSKDFPDVPENHWAYEAVSRLAGNDIVQGYPDGEFHGDRTMTRYEMAEIIYNALSRGAEAERELVEEFKPELQAMAASEKATAERAEG